MVQVMVTYLPSFPQVLNTERRWLRNLLRIISYYNYLVLFISTVTNNLQLQYKICILGTIAFPTVIFTSDVPAATVHICIYTVGTHQHEPR